MSHMALELIIWMLLVFFAGCICGCLLRSISVKQTTKLIGAGKLDSGKVSRVEMAGTLAPAYMKGATVDAPITVEADMEVTEGGLAAPNVEPPPRPSTGRPSRPKGLAAARGNADNLQQISGIGPKLEKTLHGLGFYHYDQIAEWNEDEVHWVNDHLRFKGRIEREEWIAQARLLSQGKIAEFEQLYGPGGLGSRKSGTRTRRSRKD